ncbi:hypothetical protein IPG41_06775 [Candidatus Peregrinibacteria bacterium]|nr:MAG: hypothetical protein IPG41_06775 [Candidatus Peregrinibacteria bacterium]
MRIIPNLFLQKGHAVSLYKGTENLEKKVYPRAPKNYAQWFQNQGAKTLFVVDLDGDQKDHATELRAAFKGELWWAGHVRDLATLDLLFQKGINRVVLGQNAEPIFVEALAKYGPSKLLAGIQAFHYDDVPTLCERLKGLGFSDLVVKDMNAEGTLFHPNFDLMEKAKYFSSANIFASGGVAQTNDIHLLAQAGVSGVIIGRAFYENELNVETLVQNFEGA